MRSMTAVFPTLEAATRAVDRLEAVVSRERINLILPGTPEALQEVPTTDDMPPVGGTLGAILGGSLGVVAGFTLPGIGLVTAVGVAAAAVLGAGGGVAGWKVGDALDRASSEGVPADELFVYEDALEKGRSVVIVLVDDADREPQVHEIFEESGAESLDARKEQWWLGLRDAERAEYEAPPHEFDRDEAAFRAGFECALRPAFRRRTFEQARGDLNRDPEARSPAFLRGYRRGQKYLQGRGTPSVGGP